MAKNSKAAGTRVEHKVMRTLAAEGWVVMRAPASIGVADVLALKCGERPRMVQVKANKDGGPYMNFRPTERAELRAVAERAGAVAELCWWPPRGECRWYDESIWP